jgi:hypothetical protein
MHRNTLRETYPGKDRIYRCEPRAIMLCIRNIDAARDAGDMTANNLAVAHELRRGGAAVVDGAHAVFLEISVDPERIGIDDGDFILSDIRKSLGCAARLVTQPLTGERICVRRKFARACPDLPLPVAIEHGRPMTGSRRFAAIPRNRQIVQGQPALCLSSHVLLNDLGLPDRRLGESD